MKNKSKNSKSRRSNKTVDPLADDLSNFIHEGNWEAIQFELIEKKDKVFSLRLSEKLLTELKKNAQAKGLDTQKFIRLILQNSLRKKAS